ncbi:MAG: 16S rRNA (uracil(1498)-N(3))-methyltransferase [Sphingomonadaceae bacterium]
MRQIPRLFVEAPLAPGERVLAGAQATYLAAVLRLRAGAEVRLFDDCTGEWAATLTDVGKRQVVLAVAERIAPRETPPDLWLLAAPIRPERFRWVAEKATELGVARLVPVLTERANFHRQNPERLRAHMIEAAEQCGRTALPELAASIALPVLLAGWPADRMLVFADEEGGAPATNLGLRWPAALLIGPEGGFSEAEREALLAVPNVRRLSLGPRVLRADTAAVAGLAQLLLVLG